MSNPFNYRYQKKEPTEPSAASTDVIKKKKEKPDTAGKTENFFTRNVKTITFLVCIIVFLAVFGPMSIFRIMDIIEENTVNGEIMQTEDILHYADQRNALTFAQFTAYDGEEHRMDFGNYYRIFVDDKFLVTVGSETNTDQVLYFTVTHLSTSESIDVMGTHFKIDDLMTFLSRP